jgi:hypothetical protein
MAWAALLKRPGRCHHQAVLSTATSAFRPFAGARDLQAMSLIGRNATSLRSRRAAVGALLRLGFVVLPCCVFAGLGVVVRRRLTGPSHGPTTIHYHIMGSVVHHSKIRCPLAAMGQPRRFHPVRVTSAYPPIATNARTFRIGSFVPLAGSCAAAKPARYSITSSARTRSEAGTVRPSALAAVRLISNSNLVGCSTGRSAGFAPLKILSMYSAARRNMACQLGP